LRADARSENPAGQDLNFGNSDVKSALSTALAMFFLAGCVGAAQAASTAVLTHHYDIYRTGWNQTETTLTPANVGSPQFGLLAEPRGAILYV
jgi:hypothetical protein